MQDHDGVTPLAEAGDGAVPFRTVDNCTSVSKYCEVEGRLCVRT